MPPSLFLPAYPVSIIVKKPSASQHPSSTTEWYDLQLKLVEPVLGSFSMHTCLPSIAPVQFGRFHTD